MSRAEKAQKTRLAILNAVHRLMPVAGYAGTGVAEVAGSAGLTKGALFHHFPDKRAMTAAWVDQILAPAIQHTWLDETGEIFSLPDLKRFVISRAASLTGTDAFSALVALAAEVSRSDGSLRMNCTRVFGIWKSAFAGLFQRGREQGWIYGSVNPAAEANLLLSIFCGLAVEARCSEPNDSDQNARSLEGYLDTLRSV